ncbi:SURF1 family protein [Devosia sp.]|uniref:SURF1 family protein n=1 Tax=Devosia sp. TaxID=1871048 RepID=UPI001B01FD84|nr:SURF1 family protein [Devosia sp.]MBO9591167.1 SURF1 family protein [Devosia sp.]
MTKREGQGARKLSFGLVAFAAFAAVCAVGFGALGVWQVERLAWKNSLVAAVEARSTAAPLDLDLADWSAIDPEASEYQHVSVRGRFEGDDTLSQAVTVHGGGFWVMTPLVLDDGRAVLINRGFVTAAQRDAGIPRQDGVVDVVGLLRASEPDGGFLRSNDPDAGRWYSRDVAEIGVASGVDNLAPFFVDAEAGGETYPIGGLTVLTFSNNHLVYALTWFGLTLLSLFALYWLLRDRLRR